MLNYPHDIQEERRFKRVKIFLCHSSRDKALIREIRTHLPGIIQTWLDEDDLLVGMDLTNSIQLAIQRDADYVVVFLGRDSVNSPWVKKELHWALEHEEQIGDTFVFPILLDDVWDAVEPKEFRNRLYLECYGRSARAVRGLAEELGEHLLGWMSRRLERLQERTQLVAPAGVKAIYPTRRNMPPGNHYRNLLSRVKHSLSISGISLNYVVAQNLSPVFDVVSKFPDADVRLLLFDPRSKHLDFVARFVNKNAESLKGEIIANIRHLCSRAAEVLDVSGSNRVQVRVYDAPPVCSLLAVDKGSKEGIMLVEFFCYLGDTDDRMSVELSVESPAFVAYSHSFDDLWDIAVPVKEDLWVS